MLKTFYIKIAASIDFHVQGEIESRNPLCILKFYTKMSVRVVDFRFFPSKIKCIENPWAINRFPNHFSSWHSEISLETTPLAEGNRFQKGIHHRLSGIVYLGFRAVLEKLEQGHLTVKHPERNAFKIVDEKNLLPPILRHQHGF